MKTENLRFAVFEFEEEIVVEMKSHTGGRQINGVKLDLHQRVVPGDKRRDAFPHVLPWFHVCSRLLHWSIAGYKLDDGLFNSPDLHRHWQKTTGNPQKKALVRRIV